MNRYNKIIFGENVVEFHIYIYIYTYIYICLYTQYARYKDSEGNNLGSSKGCFRCNEGVDTDTDTVTGKVYVGYIDKMEYLEYNVVIAKV